MEEKKVAYYTGFFIDKEELDGILRERGLTQRLGRAIETPHVTTAYKPVEVHQDLFGSRARIEAFAYGNDGRNEGLAVRVETADPVLAGMVRAVALPHITLSVAEDARSVDTVRLTFAPITPFVIEGVFGCRYSDDSKQVAKEQQVL